MNMTEENGQTADKANEADKAVEYLAGWKRALADYDNLKKDLGRERTEMRAAATMNTAMQLIPVLDNFDAAMKHAGDDAWAKGIGHIRTQLDDVLRQMGVEPYGAVGEMFDANLHEAVGGEGETIAEVVSRGWKLGEKIIRPAKVIINT
jgi:molecular chaperone GrpE